MKTDVLSAVGRKLKELRKQKGLNLTDVASKSGITAGLLSRIENYRTIPSLPVLYKISVALNVTLSELVKPVNGETTSQYTVIKQGEGELEARDDSEGLIYENLLSTVVHNDAVRVNLITVQPNAYRQPLSNDCIELVFVLKGEVYYGLDDEIIKLKKGDTLYFNGNIPHSLENKTSKETVLFKVYFMNPSENQGH